jgi:uncharacterized protein YjbI with pentapeptide repeats
VAADDDGTGAFRGASFTGADFTGANFRDCDLRQVKITDFWLVDVSLSGLVGRIASSISCKNVTPREHMASRSHHTATPAPSKWTRSRSANDSSSSLE